MHNNNFQNIKSATDLQRKQVKESCMQGRLFSFSLEQRMKKKLVGVLPFILSSLSVNFVLSCHNELNLDYELIT